MVIMNDLNLRFELDKSNARLDVSGRGASVTSVPDIPCAGVSFDGVGVFSPSNFLRLALLLCFLELPFISEST